VDANPHFTWSRCGIGKIFNRKHILRRTAPTINRCLHLILRL